MMTKRKLETLSLAVLTGALVLGAAACKKTETTTAVVPTTPAGETVTTTTTTTTTTTAELVPDTGADTTVVTADPVRVSQRNAARRRASSQTRSTSTGSPREAPVGEPRVAEAPVRPASRVVPEGTILRVAFNEPISTATAKEGDTVTGRLLDDILDTQGRVAIASGSRVVGMIEHAVDSGKLARPAELRMRLSEVETRRGMVPVRTSVYDRVGKTHTKRNVGYIAGGAAVGAAIGQILGKDTEGTLTGAAAGAAVGTGVAAATGDLDFSIEAGQTVAFTLQEDVVA